MTRLNVAFHRALDTNANPAGGGFLYVFVAGTTTPVSTYSDAGMLVVQAHPVVADSAGNFADVYLPSGGYKVRICDASNVVLYEADNVSLSGADSTASTVAEMVSDVSLIIGDRVHTLGYLTAGDGGGNTYEIVAAATGTADGGSYIDLTGISGQAKGLFSNTIHASKFGAVTGAGDVSAEIELANAYADGTAKSAHSAVTLVLYGNLEIAEPITIGGSAQVSVDTSNAEINCIAGGTLESGGGFAVTVQGPKTIHKLGLLKCGTRMCDGYLFENCNNSLVMHPRVEKYDAIGMEIVETSDGCTLFDPTGIQFGNAEADYWVEGNITGTFIHINGSDCKVIGGHGGYCKTPLLFGVTGFGAEVINFHPYNGQPAAGDDDGSGGTIPARDEPWAVVNNCPNQVLLRSCMVDNGHIIDNTGTLKIEGGSHNNSASRATVTEPWVRVKEVGDGSNIDGRITDFDSTFGIFTGTWIADFSNAVTDFPYTVGASRGDGRVMEMNRRKTRFIPSGTTLDDVVNKQGDATTVIQYRNTPGTGDAVITSYTDGEMIVESADGSGSIMLGDAGGNGIKTGTTGSKNLELWVDGALHSTIQSNGHFRPETGGVNDIGLSNKRWNTGYFKNLNLDSTAPTSASDTGTAGEIRADANYIYVCTAADTWKRVAIATW